MDQTSQKDVASGAGGDSSVDDQIAKMVAASVAEEHLC